MDNMSCFGIDRDTLKHLKQFLKSLDLLNAHEKDNHYLNLLKTKQNTGIWPWYLSNLRRLRWQFEIFIEGLSNLNKRLTDSHQILKLKKNLNITCRNVNKESKKN
eukprot:195547_1